MDWLLSWLWQGTALVLLVSGALRLAPAVCAATRYAIWWGTLLVVLAMPLLGPAGPVVAMTWEPGPSDVGRLVGTSVGVGDGVLPAGPVLSVPSPPEWLVAVAIGVWLGVVVLRLGRIACGLGRLRDLKRSSEPFPFARERQLVRWRVVRSRSRSARLRQSGDVAVASAVGYLRPMILIPESWATALKDDELDQIVVHEHAHVRRLDDWTKLAQTLIEAIVCFHPAVWWAGAALDLEREVACDDWAIAHGVAARDYASCLTKIAATVADPVDYALAPGVARSGTALAVRVTRLLDRRRNTDPRASLTTAFGAAGAVIAAGLLLVLFAPGITVGAGAVRASSVNPSTTAGLGATQDFDDGLLGPGEVSVGLLGPALVAPVAVTARMDVSASSPPSAPTASRRATDESSGARPPGPSEEARGRPRVAGQDTRAARPSEVSRVRGTEIVASASVDAPKPVVVPPGVQRSGVRPVGQHRASSPAATRRSRLRGVPIATSWDGRLADVIGSEAPADDATSKLVPPGDPPGRWSGPAAAGKAVGMGTKKAGLATADFVSKLGRSIASAF